MTDLPKEYLDLNEDQMIQKLKEEKIDKEIIEILYISPKWKIRKAIADSSSTSKSILELLCTDKNPDVKHSAILRLLPKDLQQLTQDDLIDKLKTISLEEKIFELLAHSSYWKIRYSIALNPYTPIKVLQNLITDTDKNVKAAFKERELPHDWKSLDFDETLNKLNEGSVDEIILRSLFQSKSIEQRKALAISSNTPASIVQQLSKDKSAGVVYAATVARKLPMELARLDKDTLIKKINQKEIDEKLIVLLSKAPFADIKRAIARHPSVSNEILERFRKDQDQALKIFAFEELIKRGESPISNFEVCGYGIELDVYEITATQYQFILKNKNIHIVDDTDWDLSSIAEDQLPIDSRQFGIYTRYGPSGIKFMSGSIRLPDQLDELFVNDHSITLQKDYETIKRSKIQITNLGNFYAIRAWENKGIWYSCSFRGEFDESKLNINILDIYIGAGNNSKSFELFELDYIEKLTKDEISSTGKGLSSFIVDDQGNVTEI